MTRRYQILILLLLISGIEAAELVQSQTYRRRYSSVSQVKILWPWLAPNSLRFTSIQGMQDSQGNEEINLGVGLRKVVGSGLVGCYGYYDLRYHAGYPTVSQITTGLEYLGERGEVRVNWYTSREALVAPGFDIEGGWGGHNWGLYTGAYYFADLLAGPRFRMRYQDYQGVIQYDKVRGLHASLSWQWAAAPGRAAESTRQWRQPIRDVDILIYGLEPALEVAEPIFINTWDDIQHMSTPANQGRTFLITQDLDASCTKLKPHEPIMPHPELGFSGTVLGVKADEAGTYHLFSRKITDLVLGPTILYTNNDHLYPRRILTCTIEVSRGLYGRCSQAKFSHL